MSKIGTCNASVLEEITLCDGVTLSVKKPEEVTDTELEYGDSEGWGAGTEGALDTADTKIDRKASKLRTKGKGKRSLFRRLRVKKRWKPKSITLSGDGDWITIGGHPEGGKHHVGGFPVQIKGGVIQSGKLKGTPIKDADLKMKEMFHGEGRPGKSKRKVKGTGGAVAPKAPEPRPQANAGPGPSEGGPADTAPVKASSVHRQLKEYADSFKAAGNSDAAQWINHLKQHIDNVGMDAALKALEEHDAEGGKEVQYEGVYDAMIGDGGFLESYLNNVGISLVGQSTAVDPNKPLVSGFSAKNLKDLGRDRQARPGDYIPTDQTLSDKLQEAKALPGLEKSEDIDKVIGSHVTRFTPDVIEKLDSTYGKDGWIVKSYGEEAYAGYGVFFPQRLKQIQRDAKSVVASANYELRDMGYGLVRDDQRQAIGIKHGRAIVHFGTPEFDQLPNHVRKLGKQVQQAAASEQAARLPISPSEALNQDYGISFRADGKGVTDWDGKDYDFDTPQFEKLMKSDNGVVGVAMDRAREDLEWRKQGFNPDPKFMVQPAFKAAGVSDYDRAMGNTWETAKEGRVHAMVKDGKASAIPFATLASRYDYFPVVFESEDTKAMEKAVEDAINALPESERTGQLYAPDVVKTKDGWRVIELNPSAEGGGSDWLGSNPFVIDALVSHVVGREPAHASFIRNVLKGKVPQIPKFKGKALDMAAYTERKTSMFLKGKPVKCRSSWIEQAQWDEETQELNLAIKPTGRVYTFPGIDRAEAEIFAEAYSKGQWYHTDWKWRLDAAFAFKEDEHPRDKVGKFAGKGLGAVRTVRHGSLKSKFSLHTPAKGSYKLKFRNYKQQDSHSCGFVAALTVTKFLTPDVKTKDVLKAVRPSKNAGIDAAGLRGALKNLGIRTRHEKNVSVEELKQYVQGGVPVLVTVFPKDWSSDHWTVVQGVSEDRVYLTNYKSLPIAQFEKEWFDKGEAIMCYKDKALAVEIAEIKPETAVEKISVINGTGELKSIMVGRLENDVLPLWYPSFEPGDGNEVGGPETAGKTKRDFNPEMYDLAIEQTEALCEVLRKEGVQVLRPPLIEPSAATAEPVGLSQEWMREVFTVFGNKLIVNQPRTPHRNKDHEALEPWLSTLTNVHRMPPCTFERNDDLLNEERPFLEGGDMFRLGDSVIITISGMATSGPGFRWLADLIEEDFPRGVWPAYITKDFEHGDYTLGIVRPGLCIAYLDGFVDGLLPGPLMDWDCVTLTKTEANEGFCTNGLVLRENTLLLPKGSPRVVRALEKKGVEVIEVPFDGPMYWQGGIRCATSELWREP